MEITVVTSVDANYLLALASMAASLNQNSSMGRQIHLAIIDGGVELADRHRIEQVFSGPARRLSWLTPNLEDLVGLKVDFHVSRATYFRLQITKLLPESVNKAIYLDCDTIVQQNIEHLWEIDLGTMALGAVQDRGIRIVSSEEGLRNFRELGLDPMQQYFNGGVLVLNLDRWREQQISQQILQYLRSHRSFIKWWDQDAMNAVLAKEWVNLDPRWNYIVSPVDFYRDDPTINLSAQYIIHYATELKPWKVGYQHRAKEIFFGYLDATPWSGWRPDVNSESSLRRGELSA